MPRYDMRCDACGWEAEVIRPMAEVAYDYYCPACGTRARRLFSVPAFVDRPTSPAIFRDRISTGLPGSKYQ